MQNRTITAMVTALTVAVSLTIAAPLDGSFNGVLAQGAPSDTQGASTDPESLPRLELNAAQKQTIYTSIVNINLKNESIPGFQPIVGAVVPEQITLEPMPKTIVEHMPATAGYGIARVANQGIIVDPKTRRVVEVVIGEKQ